MVLRHAFGRGGRNQRGRGDKGISLIVVALCMVAICGVAAIVVDLGNARQVRRELQGGVDAAALAGSLDLPVKGDNTTTRTTKQSQARNTAMAYAIRNLVGPNAVQTQTCGNAFTCTDSVGGVSFTVTTPWNPGTNSLPADTSDSNFIGYVYVQACQATPTFFAKVVNQSSPNTCRKAVGRYISDSFKGDFGLVATDPSQCAALQFEGNSTTVLTSNGAVMVNSNCTSGNAQALDSSGSSWQLKFIDSGGNYVPGYVGVVGGATLAPCDPATQTTKCTTTTPTTGISPFGDPLSGMTAPTKPSGAAATCDNKGGTISPGLFSGCKVTTGDLNIQPGIYFITGDLTFNGGNIQCVDNGATTCANTGVLLYVQGSITLNGNGKIFLPPYNAGSCSPPYVGTCYSGLSIWQTGSSTATINGTNDFSLGSVYVPNAMLKANGNGGGAQVNINGLVVAKTVDISGTFDFNIKVPSTAPDAPDKASHGLEK